MERAKVVLEPFEHLQQQHDLYKEESAVTIKQKQEQCAAARRSADSYARSNRDIELYAISPLPEQHIVE